MPKKSYNQILDEHLHILIAQGNYEAFVKLRKRYHLHASSLVHEILKQYSYTGASYRELMTICEEHFPIVVSKYVSGQASFFFYWKSSTSQQIMEYLIDRSEEDGFFSYSSIISFDQKNNESHSYAEIIGERSDDRAQRKRAFEIKHILHKYDVFFSNAEKTLINLMLEGYSLRDFEHSGVLGKSQINLTYKSAIDKIQKYMKNEY